jgi:hypothetical protein
MEKSFDQLNAALLYCNKCGRAMPDGELYDYTCQGCNNSVGSKTEKAGINPLARGGRARSGGF